MSENEYFNKKKYREIRDKLIKERDNYFKKRLELFLKEYGKDCLDLGQSVSYLNEKGFNCSWEDLSTSMWGESGRYYQEIPSFSYDNEYYFSKEDLDVFLESKLKIDELENKLIDRDNPLYKFHQEWICKLADAMCKTKIPDINGDSK